MKVRRIRQVAWHCLPSNRVQFESYMMKGSTCYENPGLGRDAPIAAIDFEEVNDLGALCDGHLDREFADRDINATMATMVPEPYVYSVPRMVGRFGGLGV